MQLADPGAIPEQPGCYRFFEGDVCLYVGKAKNLRQRLGDYLLGCGPDEARIRMMLARADRLDWTVLGSEAEALLAEASLIAELEPVYNVRLRCDHPYPSVAFDGRHGPVRLRTWRGPAIDGVDIFGPYPQRSARNIVDAVGTLHRIASCELGKYRLHERLGRPCLLGDIDRCSAPCVGRIDQASYDQSVDAAKTLLGGAVRGLQERYRGEMQVAADAQQYEQAAQARDRLRAVETIASIQLVEAANGGDLDVVGAFVDDLGGAACSMSIRSGALVAVEHFVVETGIGAVDELERTAIVALLEERRRAPAALILTGALRDAGADALHRSRSGGRARIRAPRPGRERTLYERAVVNAREALNRTRMRRAGDLDARRAELARLAEVLELERTPLRIESVDISHLGGRSTVSVVAVLVDGLPVRRQYRRYRLEDHDGDDYAAMREVVTRHFDGTDQLADLLVVDGGAGQLRVVTDVLGELGLSDRVEVVAIAKRLELLLRPSWDEPLALDPADAALHLLQRARDETHRASNAFQSQVAARSLRRDWLDDIAGIGPQRKQRLLAHFGGWRGLEDATDEAVDACSFLPSATRAALRERLVARRAVRR